MLAFNPRGLPVVAIQAHTSPPGYSVVVAVMVQEIQRDKEVPAISFIGPALQLAEGLDRPLGTRAFPELQALMLKHSDKRVWLQVEQHDASNLLFT